MRAHQALKLPKKGSGSTDHPLFSVVPALEGHRSTPKCVAGDISIVQRYLCIPCRVASHGWDAHKPSMPLQLPMSAKDFEEVGRQDDSAWLAEGGAELDAQLAARQAELDSAQQRSGARRPSEGPADEGDFDADVMAKQMGVRPIAPPAPFCSLLLCRASIVMQEQPLRQALYGWMYRLSIFWAYANSEYSWSRVRSY